MIVQNSRTKFSSLCYLYTEQKNKTNKKQTVVYEIV